MFSGNNDPRRMQAMAHGLDDVFEAVTSASYRMLAETAELRRKTYILDVGCHEGNLSAALIKRWPNLVEPFGIDRNHVALAEFNRRFGGARGKLHDLESLKALDFREGTLDLVVFSFVAEHLSPKALCRLILEAKRLAPRTLFCVHSFEALLALRIFREVEPDRFEVPGLSSAPLYIGTQEYYRQAFAAGGFKELKKVGGVNFGNDLKPECLAGTEAAAIYCADR